MAISYFAEIKGVVGWCYEPRLAFKVRDLVSFQIAICELSMTHKPEDAAIEEEIILPENLLPLGSVLGKA